MGSVLATSDVSGRFVVAAAVVAVSLAAAAATAAHDYGDALSKSLLYFEAQRSGRLPHGQRVAWRDHSGLTDGLEQRVRPLNRPAVITRRPIDDDGD